MPSACALGMIQGKIIYNFAFGAACGPLQTHFHGWGRNKKSSFIFAPLREKAILKNPQIFQNCKI